MCQNLTIIFAEISKKDSLELDHCIVCTQEIEFGGNKQVFKFSDIWNHVRTMYNKISFIMTPQIYITYSLQNIKILFQESKLSNFWQLKSCLSYIILWSILGHFHAKLFRKEISATMKFLKKFEWHFSFISSAVILLKGKKYILCFKHEILQEKY